MDASPFARLSPELRNTIYEFAFDSEYAVTLQNNGIQHGITRTCRQLRQETLEFYYTLVRFNAHLDDGPATPLARWLTVLGREECLLLREVNVWDMHMLNATLHGAESTQRLIRSKTSDGKQYVLQPTGSWLLGRGWYLKDLVVALHRMGLEMRNLSLANSGVGEATSSLVPTKPDRTSHFAIVPMTDDALQKAPGGRHPDLRDLLAHLGFSEDMIEEVFDGLEGVMETEGGTRRLLTSPNPGNEGNMRELRLRKGRRDIFLCFDGLNMISTRQTFIPHDEDFVF